MRVRPPLRPALGCPSARVATIGLALALLASPARGETATDPAQSEALHTRLDPVPVPTQTNFAPLPPLTETRLLPPLAQPSLGYWDAGVGAAALASTLFSSFLPVHHNGLWQHQLLPFDSRVEGNYSTRAATYSNVTLGLALATPLAFDGARGLNGGTVRRSAIYAETLVVNMALFEGIKHAVGRPRPYLYSAAPAAQDYAAGRGNDTWQSFYSGHSSTAFAGAVSGAWLYSQSSDNVPMRTAVWATSLLAAGATADLRVRAGQHFPSDVLLGAAVGSTLGYLIPRLHYWGKPVRSLSAPEWVAIVVAPLLGALIAQHLPLEPPQTVP